MLICFFLFGSKYVAQPDRFFSNTIDWVIWKDELEWHWFTAHFSEIKRIFILKTQYILTNSIHSILQIKYSQRGTIADGAGTNAEDYEHWLRFHKPIKPENQVDLSEAELSEEITKHLDTEHKDFPQNLVVYSFKDYGYISVRSNLLMNIILLFHWIINCLQLFQPPNIGIIVDVPSNSVLVEGEDGEKPPEDIGPATHAGKAIIFTQKKKCTFLRRR